MDVSQPNMSTPPPGPSRRTVLRRGLFGGVLLALGGGGFLAFRPGATVPLPPEGLLALDGRGYAVLSALAHRLVPAREGFPSVDEVRVAFNADRILARVDDGARKELSELLGLFDNALASFLFGGRTKPFTALSPEAQDAVIRDWSESPFVLRRTGMQALRSLLLAAYYGSPSTWAAVGYPGPPEGFHQKDAPVWKGGAR